MNLRVFQTVLTLACFIVAPCFAAAGELKPVNVKFMVRGYCYAGSRADKEALGGYGQSDNLPKPVKKEPMVPGEIKLVALTEEAVPLPGSYRGFRLLLINGTKKEARFHASDSMLPIVREARNLFGLWKPIEYLPMSDCGNSDHRVFLPAHSYWEFDAPTYGGKTRTRMRFVLHEAGRPAIYSNEFEGTIDRAQFSQKQGHRRQGLMDPYRE